MWKLMVTVGVFLALALAVLGLRQYRWELTAQTAKIRHEMDERDQTLWGQQEAIAKQTNPLTLAEGLKRSGLELGGANGPTTMAALERGPDRDRYLVPPPRRRRTQ